MSLQEHTSHHTKAIASSKKYTNIEDKDVQKIRDDQIADLENKRTILQLSEMFPPNTPKYLFGITLYVVVFVLIIPYMIMRSGRDELLLAYVPNVDMIATVLGYHGGPTVFGVNDMWLLLYNPSNFSLIGFLSANMMNYFALLGATFLVAHTTYKTRSWKIGWSAAFIFLIITYLAPGNIIVIMQEKLGVYLEKSAGFGEKTNSHYVVVVGFGLLLVAAIILFEAMVIRVSKPYILKLINAMNIRVG